MTGFMNRVALLVLVVATFVVTPASAQQQEVTVLETFTLQFRIYRGNHTGTGPDFFGLDIDEIETNEAVLTEIVAYARAHPGEVIQVVGMSNQERYDDRSYEAGLEKDRQIASSRAFNAFQRLQAAGIPGAQFLGHYGDLFRVGVEGSPVAYVHFVRIPTGGQGETGGSCWEASWGADYDPPGDYNNDGEANSDDCADYAVDEAARKLWERRDTLRGPEGQKGLPGISGQAGPGSFETVVLGVRGTFGNYGYEWPYHVLPGTDQPMEYGGALLAEIGFRLHLPARVRMGITGEIGYAFNDDERKKLALGVNLVFVKSNEKDHVRFTWGGGTRTHGMGSVNGNFYYHRKQTLFFHSGFSVCLSPDKKVRTFLEWRVIEAGWQNDYAPFIFGSSLALEFELGNGHD